jgi:hypothetical protein
MRTFSPSCSVVPTAIFLHLEEARLQPRHQTARNYAVILNVAHHPKADVIPSGAEESALKIGMIDGGFRSQVAGGNVTKSPG